MKRSEVNPMPEFFDRYIKLVEDIDVVEALEKHSSLFGNNDLEVFTKLGDTVYAPGKWTGKEIIQHITDNERVQSYRAMRFSRKDETALPGYDPDLLSNNSTANQRSYEELLEEFKVVRQSSILLFKSFSREMLQRGGVCNSKYNTVLGLGFVISGHQIHHVNILRERYLPLTDSKVNV